MKPSRIGFLATGDEVCDGDIVNTNTPALARLLKENGWKIGHTLTVPDDEEAILKGFEYLAKEHDVIISIGGLGPTTDDRTRFALARFVKEELVFNEDSWQRLCERFKQYLRLDIPDNNRQQALFPKSAVVLSNRRGSADSCWIEHQHKIIFMLPGPPAECLGVMRDHVLAILKNHQYLNPSTDTILRWYLLGVSEGQIATEMEALLATDKCRTGYRAEYPYLEFKVWFDEKTSSKPLYEKITNALSNYCLMPVPKTASQYCIACLLQQQELIQIQDEATGGILQSLLASPQTYSLLRFTEKSEQNPSAALLQIKGLDAFWENFQNDETPPAVLETKVNILFKRGTQSYSAEKTFPIRNRLLARYAAEWVCYQLVQWLLNKDKEDG
ncbi:MAG: cinA [Gammaproteobacteria bacterium]|jgi:nicotinamide-nucleotide amidase|nr:cinA [Gammaproteobacteria bacterium]